MSPPSIKNRVSSLPNFEHNKIIQARIETLEIQQRLLGENHPDVIFSLSSLAKLCQKRGDYEGALSIMRETQVRSMKAKALAYEQQLNKNQQLEVQNGRDEALVPSNISFSNDNSYSGWDQVLKVLECLPLFFQRGTFLSMTFRVGSSAWPNSFRFSRPCHQEDFLRSFQVQMVQVKDFPLYLDLIVLTLYINEDAQYYMWIEFCIEWYQVRIVHCKCSITRQNVTVIK